VGHYGSFPEPGDGSGCLAVDVAHPLDLHTFFIVVSLVDANSINPKDYRPGLVTKMYQG
jgi:hypothetical protein